MSIKLSFTQLSFVAHDPIPRFTPNSDVLMNRMRILLPIKDISELYNHFITGPYLQKMISSGKWNK